MSRPAGAAPTDGRDRYARAPVHAVPRASLKGAVWSLAAFGGALALAGCSSGTTSAGSTSTAPPRSTTTAAPSTSTSSAATTTTGAGVAACRAAQLQMATGQSNGAAGTIELSVTMKNGSGTGCSMNGYPGMQLLSSTGAALPTNVVRGGGPSFPVAAANGAPTSFVLAPQSSAGFYLSYEDVPVGTETSCPTSSQAEITPPNAFDHAVVALQIAPCGGGTVHVSPVYPAG